MPTWTEEDLKNYERRQKRTNQVQGVAPSSEPEQPVCDDSLGSEPRKASDSGKYFVRIESRRLSLIDPDNLCAKYFIDGLRYAGLIPDDSPEFIEISVSQRKVPKDTEECTLIEIIPLTEI